MLWNRMKAAARRDALVAVVLAMVVGVGLAAVVASDRTTSAQEGIHRADRLSLADSLATLAQGYFLQLAAAQQRVGSSVAPELGSPASVSRALDSALTNTTGDPLAVVVDSAGVPLGASRGAAALAPAFPEIQAELLPALVARKVPISSVIDIAGAPSVAIAVPCGSTGAILVTAYRLADLPIASYVQRLVIGPGAASYVLDRSGRMVTSPAAARIGERAPGAVLAAARRGTAAAVVQTGGSAPEVVARMPVGVGGWTLLIAQPAAQFYGSLWHGDERFAWSMLGLVVIVAGALLLLHSRRQRALGAVADMAVRDPLTGLPNRLAFTRSLSTAMRRHQRGEGDVALLFCDLDGFKAVNDQLGHDAGDALLVAAAERLRSAVGEHGPASAPELARLGGDEFTVLLEGGHAHHSAGRLATALTDSFAEPFVLGPDEVDVGVSVGVAFARPDRDLLRDADVAMYRAKAIRRAAREAGAPDRFSGAGGATAVRDAS